MCQEDQRVPCCWGLKVILEIRVIIVIEDTFQNLTRTLELSIFSKKQGTHPQHYYSTYQMWESSGMGSFDFVKKFFATEPVGKPCLINHWKLILQLFTFGQGCHARSSWLLYIQEMLRLTGCIYSCWTICVLLNKWQRKPDRAVDLISPFPPYGKNK